MPVNTASPSENRLRLLGIKTIYGDGDPTTALGSDMGIPTLYINNSSKNAFLLTETDPVTWVDVGAISFGKNVLSILDASATPPVGPTTGQAYLLDSTTTIDAAWVTAGATYDDRVEWSGSSWLVSTPVQGDIVYVNDVANFYIYDGSDWILLSGSISGLTYVVDSRPPNTSDNTQAVPTLWIDTNANTSYILTDVTATIATWLKMADNTLGDAQNSVLSIATSTSAPPTEVLGDRYILSSDGAPNAAWDGAAQADIAQFDGATWVALTPSEGTFCEVEDEDTVYIFITSWVKMFNYTGATFASDSGNATPDTAGIITFAGTTAQGLDSSATGSTVTYTIADATTSQKGTLETALDSEANTGTATDLAVVPANLGQWPGTTNITTLGTIATGVWNGTTIAIANGGTGSTSFTDGSVVFSNGTILTEDNSNFFWDRVNSRLGLGTTTPLDTFHVVGAIELDHTATEDDDHAIEIVCDAAGFGDVKAVDLDYITGAVGATQDEEVILVNIDETLSTGGQVSAMQVLATTEGSVQAIALKCGPNIDAIRQEVGTFGNMDSALNIAVDVLAALSSGGAGNITTFVADNDTFTIGDAASFGAIEVILDTGASGAGIAPTWEYSTGVGTWATFSPADGTNGFRNTGVVEWDVTDLSGFAVGTGSEFLIRITRTRNSLSTTPIIDLLQISALTEYKWDKDGAINAASLTLATDLAVTEGGSGRSSHTAYGVICGGTTTTAAQQSIASVGTAAQVLTSNGAGALPTFQNAAVAPTDFTDSTFRIQDDGDATKEIAFQASGITTGTTRTITMVDADITLLNPASVAITGGAIDGTTVGSTTTAAGAFTTVGVGTTAVPHGSVGSGIAAIEGANSSTSGPHMQFTTASDDYPLIQILPWSHDNVNIYFDGYRDSGGQKSSSANGNFRIKKGNDVIQLSADEAITAGSAATFVDILDMTADGQMTLPLQSAFIVIPSAQLNNVTGNGAVYNPVYASTTLDQNSDFDGTSTFTAPKTGVYMFQICHQIQNVTSSATSWQNGFTHSSRGTIGMDLGDIWGNCSSGGGLYTHGTKMLKMTAAQTLKGRFYITGMAGNSVDIGVDSDENTYFAGVMVC
ncbi:DUF2793 domain-containing protein [bacterium]|nr:DUF2793 domain-containing protein [bacterium]